MINFLRKGKNMSKAIGNVFALGLAPKSEDDEEKERLAQMREQAQAYAQSAKPIDEEYLYNSANEYLNRLTNDNGYNNNQNYYNFAKPITAFNGNNLQYAQLADANTATDAEIQENNVDYSLYGDDFSKEEIDRMLQDQNYQQALNEYAIPNEGGYVNNPNDPGGETNMGITKRYHSNEDIKNLTRERANAILYNEVWNWNGINKLPPEIQGFVFDYGIRTSPQNAINTVHQALDIPPGGTIIGDTTLNRLNDIDYEEFLRRYQSIIRNRDKMNVNYKYFGSGWDNRTNRYHVSHK